MSRLLPATVILFAVACAACGDVTLKDPDAAVDARVDVPDALPEAPDAQPGAPDARASDAGPPDAAPPCTEGAAQVQDPQTGACYMLFTNDLGWVDARDACTGLDPSAHLATMSSFDENDLVLDLTEGLDTWMGATDANIEGQFVWVTGDLMEFELWADGEPNNGGGTGGEDCAVLLNANERPGAWDDRPCGGFLPYVCERD